jgi:hypothetical protein
LGLNEVQQVASSNLAGPTNEIKWLRNLVFPPKLGWQAPGKQSARAFSLQLPQPPP